MNESAMTTTQPTGEPSELTLASFEVLPPSALQIITKAEIDIQISTAKQYPRVFSLVKQRMIQLATLDIETAESCFYVLNRQGKNIDGPSIRLAEIAASQFGNIRAGAQVIDNDGKTITARGFCHDLETNTMFTNDVKRRITYKNGQTYSDDMQVVTGNAACSIALRNAVFRTVPFALIKPVFEQAKKVAVGDVKTLAERRTRMLKTFAALGVNEQRLLAAIEKAGVEDIGIPELTTLIGMHSAIKDGERTVEDAFPPVAQKAATTRAALPTKPAAAPAPTITTGGNSAVASAVVTPTQEPANPELEKPAATTKTDPGPKPTKEEVIAKPAAEPETETPKGEQITVIADEDLESTLVSLASAVNITQEELEAWARGKNLLPANKPIQEIRLPRLRTMVESWEEAKKQILGARPK